jgi:uncharacterized protein with beta-barrel porin domain
VWTACYGGSQTTGGNAALGSNSATSRVFGAAVGADYRVSPFTLAGFALAGGGTRLSAMPSVAPRATNSQGIIKIQIPVGRESKLMLASLTGDT